MSVHTDKKGITVKMEQLQEILCRVDSDGLLEIASYFEESERIYLRAHRSGGLRHLAGVPPALESRLPELLKRYPMEGDAMETVVMGGVSKVDVESVVMGQKEM